MAPYLPPEILMMICESATDISTIKNIRLCSKFCNEAPNKAIVFGTFKIHKNRSYIGDRCERMRRLGLTVQVDHLVICSSLYNGEFKNEDIYKRAPFNRKTDDGQSDEELNETSDALQLIFTDMPDEKYRFGVFVDFIYHVTNNIFSSKKATATKPKRLHIDVITDQTDEQIFRYLSRKSGYHESVGLKHVPHYRHMFLASVAEALLSVFLYARKRFEERLNIYEINYRIRPLDYDTLRMNAFRLGREFRVGTGWFYEMEVEHRGKNSCDSYKRKPEIQARPGKLE